MAARKEEKKQPPDFVSIMLEKASQPREKTEPNVNTKESPETIEQITKRIKDRLMQ